MATTNRFDEIIVRNRAHRLRDLGIALVLGVVTVFALASIGRAGGSSEAALSFDFAPACAVTTSC